jgi:hypothetical protein
MDITEPLNHMKQTASWEADSRSAGQEIPDLNLEL